jgi:phage I-like protein
MQELSLRAAARFTHEEDAVDLKTFLAALAALLAIDPGSDQDAVLAACKAVVGKATEAETQLAALKQAGDPARFVPLGAFEALKGELAALKSAQLDRDVESLVETALADGKLLAVQTDWARTLGKRDLAALKAYLEKTPPIAALKGTQTGGKPRGDGGAAELDETEIAVCRAMGIQPDAYKQLRSAA